MPGATTYSSRNIDILAGGKDIWETRDEFHFACAKVLGDFELSVRLASLTMADVYTKAGLMLRASLAEGAEHAFLLAFGDNQPRNKNNGGLEFQSREALHGPCTAVYPPQPLRLQPDFPVKFPLVWLKLVRDGHTITGQCSQDGEEWRTYCVHEQPLPRTAYLGLAVTSHNSDKTVRAIFDQLVFRGEILRPNGSDGTSYPSR